MEPQLPASVLPDSDPIPGTWKWQLQQWIKNKINPQPVPNDPMAGALNPNRQEYLNSLIQQLKK